MEIEIKPGKIEIYCRYIVKKGKKIYPKNKKFFHFWVDEKTASSNKKKA